MARGAETVVFVVDLSLNTRDEDVKDAVLWLQQQVVEKLLYNPKDEVGIITFGTSETKNDLCEELGGYDGISVAVPWQTVSPACVDAIHKLTKASKDEKNDCVSAVVVAMDLMLKAKGKIRKGTKKIVLVTSGLCTLREDEEPGATEEQVDQLSSELAAQGVQLSVVLLPPAGRGGPKAEEGENLPEEAVEQRGRCVALLRRFLEGAEKAAAKGDKHPSDLDGSSKGKHSLWQGVGAAEGSLETPLGDLRELASLKGLLFRGRHRVQPMTSFRGELEVMPEMRIKVWAYKKTMKQHLPALKPYSEEAPASDTSATHDVRMEREYRLRDDPDVAVQAADLVKAYKYGPQVIPISDMERAAMQFHADKGIKLLGFTRKSDIPRHFFMNEASLFLPPPGDREAAAALSALARAMDQAGQVAVARCKFTQREDSGVVLAVLTPCLSRDPEVEPDALYCNTLPFAEDIREFMFASLESQPQKLQPTEAQVAAAEELVLSLNLGPQISKGGKGAVEHLRPQETASTGLQAYHELVRRKILGHHTQADVEDEADGEGILVPSIWEGVPWADDDSDQNKKFQQVIRRFSAALLGGQA